VIAKAVKINEDCPRFGQPRKPGLIEEWRSTMTAEFAAAILDVTEL
jgi:hypothetical protein